jgi:uncharacterized membrane protein
MKVGNGTQKKILICFGLTFFNLRIRVHAKRRNFRDLTEFSHKYIKKTTQ